mmetsp:Transcript_38878/g.72193  ORF Transcript_38878/g.72193 Transcript_38878/m.72193 type:complete len:1375 (-) Transcript_38878:86-4210(-)
MSVDNGEDDEAPRKPVSSENANWFSRLFFLWVGPRVALSQRQCLEDSDICDIPATSKVQCLTEKFDKHWNPKACDPKALEGGKHLMQIGKKIFGPYYFMAISLMFVQQIAQCAAPLFLKAFIDWYVNPLSNAWEGWLLSGLMVFLQIIGSQICANHGIMYLYLTGMDCRSLLNALIYRKALRMSQKARSQTTLGQVVNLMSADSERLPMALLSLNAMFTTPLVIIYGIVSLIAIMGWAGLVAVFILILTIPFPMKIGAYQGKAIAAQMRLSDSRIKTVNEGLSGIKILKCYAWDRPFRERVANKRREEINAIRKLSWSMALNLTIMTIVPIIMGLGMIATYYALNKDDFTPANVFTGLALLNLIKNPLVMLPGGIKGWIDLKSTTTRLQRYLLLDENDADSSGATEAAGQTRAEIKSGTFEWEVGAPVELSAPVKGKGKGKGNGTAKSKDDAKPSKGDDQSKEEEQGKGGNGNGEKVTDQGKEEAEKEGTKEEKVEEKATFSLRDISVVGEAGQLCAVVGKVGSGKSSLLSALLSEMPKRSGEVTMKGSIAYCAQVPWIQNATVRDNILFGSPMDEERYDEVINMCALGTDCESLPAGDLTEIGEKGVTLSGGQKARIALARACYRRADVYLLDDVLSAVDAETGAWLFELCIKELLNRKCLVILATNAVHFLKDVDAVWVLKAGSVIEQGTFDELRAKEGGELNELLSLVAIQDAPAVPEAPLVKPRTSLISEAVRKSRGRFSVSSVKTDEKAGILGVKEARAEGSVSWKVWYFYFVTCPGGFCIPLTVLLCSIVGQASKNFFEYWLSYWTTESVKGENKDHYFIVYGVLGIVACIFQLCRSISLAEMILLNGRRLHDLLLGAVMRAMMSFFDTTLTGRIMNRFSKDMDSMDNRLQMCLPAFMLLFMEILGIGLTIGLNMPLFFVFLIPMLMFYWDVSRRFRPLNRDLQRLESTSRSPLFSLFSETLHGSSTVRAYGEVHRFLSQSDVIIDSSNRAFYAIHTSNRWLQLRLEAVGMVLLIAVLGFALEGRSSGNADPGIVALALFYVITIGGILNFTIRMLTETEARMTSCERIHEYTTTIEPEAADFTNERPPPSWPSKGRIELRDVSMRYRPNLPLVLNKVSFAVEGGYKLGICGRTGSGKSTLFSILFRIVDVYRPGNECQGCIEIDGIDVGKIGLTDLRRALAIIPQDPVMFAGDVRENLDLFQERTDEELWTALQHASMDTVVKQMPDGLGSLVHEGGENFSCGERQLVCMARALLRQSKIICLDEATANIDIKTDATIQEVMKTEFADCTVLTIAHRLNTIATHDQILVMDQGEVAELGSPAELLALGETGKFWSLVQELGESGAEALENEVKSSVSKAAVPEFTSI